MDVHMQHYGVYFEAEMPVMKSMDYIEKDTEVKWVIRADSFRDALLKCDFIREYAKRKECVDCLMIRPQDEPVYTAIPRDMRKVENIIGGKIKISYSFDLKGVALLSDEFGKIRKEGMNRALYYKEIFYDIISGVMICAQLDAHNDLVFMDIDKIVRAYETFKTPEIFLYDKEQKVLNTILLSPEAARIMRENDISYIG